MVEVSNNVGEKVRHRRLFVGLLSHEVVEVDAFVQAIGGDFLAGDFLSARHEAVAGKPDEVGGDVKSVGDGFGCDVSELARCNGYCVHLLFFCFLFAFAVFILCFSFAFVNNVFAFILLFVCFLVA
jgi:hypothetical protein